MKLARESYQLSSPPKKSFAIVCNIVDRAAISVGELSEMQHRIEEQQKKIDNSEMLGTAGARLEEELRQLKLESQRLGDQLLETKRQLEYAGNQRESCRRQVETLKKELEDVANVAETKTRECIALVDERECLARELENAEIDNRKLRCRGGEPQRRSYRGGWRPSTRRARSADLQAFMNFYSCHRGPQPVLSRNITKRWQCSVIRTRVVDMFEIILRAKKIMEDEEARNIYDKYGIEKAQDYMNSKMDI